MSLLFYLDGRRLKKGLWWNRGVFYGGIEVLEANILLQKWKKRGYMPIKAFFRQNSLNKYRIQNT